MLAIARYSYWTSSLLSIIIDVWIRRPTSSFAYWTSTVLQPMQLHGVSSRDQWDMGILRPEVNGLQTSHRPQRFRHCVSVIGILWWGATQRPHQNLLCVCYSGEETVLKNIKTLAVRKENVMVARVKLQKMRQDRDGPVRAFAARLQRHYDPWRAHPRSRRRRNPTWHPGWIQTRLVTRRHTQQCESKGKWQEVGQPPYWGQLDKHSSCHELL